MVLKMAGSFTQYCLILIGKLRSVLTLKRSNMSPEELQQIQEMMTSVANAQGQTAFRNQELSHRERIKERYSYLKRHKMLIGDDAKEFNYLTYLVEHYFEENKI
jgi:hypothetical protein